MATMNTNLHNSLQTSMSNFISNYPHLRFLENHCTNVKEIMQTHAHLVKTGLSKHPIAISRVLAFAATSSAARIDYAHSIFTRIDYPNLFMWNTIIRGFAHSSRPENAIFMFVDMLMDSTVEPQKLTYPSLFKAYAQLGLACSGAQLHGRIVKEGLQCDTFIRNTIIYMYANCGFLDEAYKMFYEEKDLDVVAWNSMIMGLAKSREIEESRMLFDELGSRRNTISWNSIISGYVRNGKFVEALQLFWRMQEEGMRASEFTVVSLLNACANLGSLEQGEWLYNYVVKHRFELNVILVTAIVDMYCKCGAIEKARHVFRRASTRGLSSWNAMILGLANNGCEHEAMEFFSELVSLDIGPNDVTFLGLLTACSYKGSVAQARDYFLLMMNRYKIEPSVKHYNCMISVLGQAGLLNEAKHLINDMPIEPDAFIWGSLLSACRKHGDVEMAAWAAEHINEIDSNDSAAYILMANVYAASGEFQNAINQRVFMKEKQVSKEKGCSSIEINGQFQEFVSGETLHPQLYDLTSGVHSNCKDVELVIEEFEL